MKHINDYKIKNSPNKRLNLVGKVRLKLLMILAFVLIASFFAQLVFAGNLAVGGQKLAEIEGDIKKLEAENMTLRVEIAKEAALSSLDREAKKQGFEKPQAIITPN